MPLRSLENETFKESLEGTRQRNPPKEPLKEDLTKPFKEPANKEHAKHSVLFIIKPTIFRNLKKPVAML